MTVAEFAETSSKGPFSMQDRYVTEDIPMGAALTVSIARGLGLPTPTYDAMIHLASVVNDTEFLRGGRTLASLGLDELTPEAFEEYLQTGLKPPS